MCVGICAAVYIKPLSAPDEGRKGCVYLCCFFSLIPSHTLLVLISLFSVNPMEGSGKRGKKRKDEKGERGSIKGGKVGRRVDGRMDGWMEEATKNKRERERRLRPDSFCVPEGQNSFFFLVLI